MVKRLPKWVLRSIGPIILIYIVWNIDLGELRGILRRCSPGFLLAALFMIIPALLLRAARWKSLLSGQGLHSGFVETVNIYSYSILIGLVTPGHIGEFVKVFYLKKRGLSLGGSFFSVFLDRILDILFLFMVGAVALFALISSEARNVTISALFIAGILGAFASLWFFTRGRGFDLVLVGLKRFSPTRFRGKMLSGFSDFADGFQRMTMVGATLAFALTAFAWTANYYAVYLLGRSLGFELSFPQMAGVAAISSFVALLPISIMGVGTRDAALIVLLAQYGVSEERAVAFRRYVFQLSFGVHLFARIPYSRLQRGWIGLPIAVGGNSQATRENRRINLEGVKGVEPRKQLSFHYTDALFCDPASGRDLSSSVEWRRERLQAFEITRYYE